MSYTEKKKDEFSRTVYLVDNGDGMSITNDAESILKKYKQLGIDYIIYKDTMGEWFKMYYGKTKNWMGGNIVWEKCDDQS
jgi:hypothetical protein